MMLPCRCQFRLPQRPPAVWNRRNTCRPSSAPSPSTSKPTAATPSPTVPSSACPQVLQRDQVQSPLSCLGLFLSLFVFFKALISSWFPLACTKCYLCFGLISKGTGAQLCGYVRRTGHDEVTSHPSLSLHSVLSTAV